MTEPNSKIIMKAPYSWYEYTTYSAYALEIIPGTLYDTQIYWANDTTILNFFRDSRRDRSWTNMVTPGMLPNPQAFLIESIAIYGITSNIAFGSGVLHIGNKHYGFNPAWNYGLKQKGYKLRPNLMISTLQHFEFVLTWEKAEPLGQGMSGAQRDRAPIQVVMYGQLARAVA